LQREAPFITKALKLVSIAIIVSTVAIAATAAYSGYQEYGALTSSVIAGGASRASISLNGSNVEISGLEVPNRMTFPLTLELLGGLSLNNVSIGSFDSGAVVIQPNQSRSINLTVPINYQQLLNDSELLRQAAFNSSQLGITTTISAHMVPLLGINITKSANTISGPILGDLSTSLNFSGVEFNGGMISVPFALTWQNSSPLTLSSFWIQANLTQIPGRTSGNYGYASGAGNLVAGYNSQTLELNLPLSDFSGGTPAHGNYTFAVQVSQSSSSRPFLQFVRTVSE
jgi:hypothetical protein